MVENGIIAEMPIEATPVIKKMPETSPSEPIAARAISCILDASEKVFGSRGFEGAGMRAIAEEAGISQSLLHYHFKNKAALYEATFERRASVISRVRLNKLDELCAAQSDIALEQVLSILFMPLDELLGEPKGKLLFYIQMLAEVTTSPDDRSVAIVKKFYDPSALYFIPAFRKALPKLTQDQAAWAYLFAIGARMQAHSLNGRAERLGAKSLGKRPYSMLVRFTAAGIKSLVNT